MRLIDADKLIEDYGDCIVTYVLNPNHGTFPTYKETALFDYIETMPFFEPVKHGRWDITGRCSNCGKYCGVRKPDYSYCPNCGARMDEVGE